MRNFIHTASLVAAPAAWLLGLFWGIQQPLITLAGTSLTMVFLALALKTSQEPTGLQRVK